MTGIIRRHQAGEVEGIAVFSPCGSYRYLLERRWDKTCPTVVFILLNPSTADERTVDATLRVCLRRAEMGGFGRIRVLNLFAWRATRPADLLTATDPVGTGNEAAILRGLPDLPGSGDRLVCGWGNGGHLQGRGLAVAQRLRAAGQVLHHLGLTASGAPRHPLYVPLCRPMARWEPA